MGAVVEELMSRADGYDRAVDHLANYECQWCGGHAQVVAGCIWVDHQSWCRWYHEKPTVLDAAQLARP